METKVVLVCVMGLPGSGKTTLCKGIKTHIRKDQDKDVIHLCFDDLIPLAVQRQLVWRKRSQQKGVEEEGGGKEKDDECKIEENMEDKNIQQEQKEDLKVEGKKEIVGKESVNVFDIEKNKEEGNRNQKGIKESLKEGKKRIVDKEKDVKVNERIKDEKEQKNGIQKEMKEGEEGEAKLSEENINEKEKDGDIVEGKGNTEEEKEEEKKLSEENIKKEKDGEIVKEEDDVKEEREGKQRNAIKKINKNSEIEHETDIEGEDQVPADWKEARRSIHTQLDTLLRHLTAGTTEITQVLGIPLTSLKRTKRHAILLDDNFYYRSMRYEYHQLARKHHAAFCQVYVECSADDAISRNNSRVPRVPEEVITVMNTKLQPPQPSVNAWEENTCTVYSSDHENVTAACGAIDKSFRRGLKPIEIRDQEIEEARRRCSQSVIHQSDLILRSVVKRLTREEIIKGDMPKETIGVSVNRARKLTLQQLREGSVDVPIDFAEEITQDNRLNFELFLEKQMKQKLNVSK